MRTLNMLFAVAALSTMQVGVASARPFTPGVDRREVRQHVRIQAGVRSGELTRGEAARLRMGQGHVRRMERRAKSDGVVTPRERVRVNRAQNRQNRRIVRLKHNGRGC